MEEEKQPSDLDKAQVSFRKTVKFQAIPEKLEDSPTKQDDSELELEEEK